MTSARIEGREVQCGKCHRGLGRFMGGLLTSRRWYRDESVDPPIWRHGRRSNAGPHRVEWPGGGWLDTTGMTVDTGDGPRDASRLGKSQFIRLPLTIECPNCRTVQEVRNLSD